MVSLNDIKDTFYQECEDLLVSLSDGLQQMDGTGFEMETVHAVFRAVHSIKGGAGAFGLTDLVVFAHRFETMLDEIRSNRLAIRPDVMHVLHRCGDHLSDLVNACRDDVPRDAERTAELLAELDSFLGGTPEEEDPQSFVFTPLSISIDDLDADLPDDPGRDPSGDGTPAMTPDPVGGADGPAVNMRLTRISFAPTADLYASGNDPALLFRSLARLGSLETELLDGAVPDFVDLDPQASYLKWQLSLHSSAPRAEIEAAFEFVTDVCALQFDRVTDEQTVVGIPDLFAVLASRKPPQIVQHPPSSLNALGDQTNGGRADQSDASRVPATIRVNLDRVDRLINLIGELVIKEAMLSQLIEQTTSNRSSDVPNALDGVKKLAGEIQECVMAIRAQPLKPVFQRMQRIVREAADATGKKVRILSLGEQTEVDKTVIERLVDPLTHMIRNSVDHGLEDAPTRLAAGKPEEGTVTLSAAHRSGRVIIDVKDDGAGINRARVRQIAEDRGLIMPGATLSTSEIDNLLFLPGFSSKAEVSALSGRGVGLDVVRREIQSLGGRVMIHSVEGEGTTFSIALPLTLAVLEGMLVDVSGERMVVPITAIQQTIRPSSAQIHALGRSGRVLSSRGELIPIIDLVDAFGLPPSRESIENRVILIVETDTGRRAALLIDRIQDQRQVVIKSLEDNYGRVPGISAATILGDGRIALIIDPEEIVAHTVADHLRLSPALEEIG